MEGCMRKVATGGAAVVLLGVWGVFCTYGRDGVPISTKASNRPYRKPDPSVLQLPIIVPFAQARDQLITSLPNPLSAGSREIEIDAKTQVHESFISISFKPGVKFDWFGPHPTLVEVRTPIDRLVDKLFKAKITVNYRVSVVPGTVTLQANKGQIHATMDADYHVDAQFKPGPLPLPLTPPGTAEGRIHLAVSRSIGWNGGKIVLVGGGRSAKIAPKLSFSPLNPLTPPLDPGAILGTKVFLDLLSSKINERVQAGLPGHVVDFEKMLKGLESPLDLGIGPKVYINAERVSPWTWESDATRLASGLTIHCRPGTQSRPAKVAFDAARARPADLSSRVDLEYTLTRDEFSRRFADVLRQSFDKDSRLELGAPLLSPAGDATLADGPKAVGRVLIEVRIRAPVVRTLTAQGLLWLDGNSLAMKDVKVETKLSRHDRSGGDIRPKGPPEIPKADSVDSIAALEHLRCDLTDKLKELTSQPRTLRVNSVSVTLKLTRSGLKEVHVTPNSGLNLVLHIEGEARLAVTP